MTALFEYDRLESTGVWRASPEAQRRDVIVSVGEATLIIGDQNDTAISHWSLPAIERVNPGKRPALFRPGDDAVETLELTDETLIQAIGKVHTAIERRRPHPGRLRFFIVGGICALFAALAVFWLPGAMIKYTAAVVPQAKQIAIGERLVANIRRVSGSPCESPQGVSALDTLNRRIAGEEGGRLIVLAGGVQAAQHVPGGIVLLNRALVEDYEDPAVVAGYILAERERAKKADPILALLHWAGIRTTFRLLTTGEIPDLVLAHYAETLLTKEPLALGAGALLPAFEASKIRATPYAYSIDISGETTIGLIEADPIAPGNAEQILRDSAWVALQGICGE